MRHTESQSHTANRCVSVATNKCRHKMHVPSLLYFYPLEILMMKQWRDRLLMVRMRSLSV